MAWSGCRVLILLLFLSITEVKNERQDSTKKNIHKVRHGHPAPLIDWAQLEAVEAAENGARLYDVMHILRWHERDSRTSRVESHKHAGRHLYKASGIHKHKKAHTDKAKVRHINVPRVIVRPDVMAAVTSGYPLKDDSSGIEKGDRLDDEIGHEQIFDFAGVELHNMQNDGISGVEQEVVPSLEVGYEQQDAFSGMDMRQVQQHSPFSLEGGQVHTQYSSRSGAAVDQIYQHILPGVEMERKEEDGLSGQEMNESKQNEEQAADDNLPETQSHGEGVGRDLLFFQDDGSDTESLQKMQDPLVRHRSRRGATVRNSGENRSESSNGNLQYPNYVEPVANVVQFGPFVRNLAPDSPFTARENQTTQTNSLGLMPRKKDSSSKWTHLSNDLTDTTESGDQHLVVVPARDREDFVEEYPGSGDDVNGKMISKADKKSGESYTISSMNFVPEIQPGFRHSQNRPTPKQNLDTFKLGLTDMYVTRPTYSKFITSNVHSSIASESSGGYNSLKIDNTEQTISFNLLKERDIGDVDDDLSNIKTENAITSRPHSKGIGDASFTSGPAQFSTEPFVTGETEGDIDMVKNITGVTPHYVDVVFPSQTQDVHGSTDLDKSVSFTASIHTIAKRSTVGDENRERSPKELSINGIEEPTSDTPIKDVTFGILSGNDSIQHEVNAVTTHFKRNPDKDSPPTFYEFLVSSPEVMIEERRPDLSAVERNTDTIEVKGTTDDSRLGAKTSVPSGKRNGHQLDSRSDDTTGATIHYDMLSSVFRTRTSDKIISDYPLDAQAMTEVGEMGYFTSTEDDAKTTMREQGGGGIPWTISENSDQAMRESTQASTGDTATLQGILSDHPTLSDTSTYFPQKDSSRVSKTTPTRGRHASFTSKRETSSFPRDTYTQRHYTEKSGGVSSGGHYSKTTIQDTSRSTGSTASIKSTSHSSDRSFLSSEQDKFSPPDSPPQSSDTTPRLSATSVTPTTRSRNFTRSSTFSSDGILSDSIESNITSEPTFRDSEPFTHSVGEVSTDDATSSQRSTLPAWLPTSSRSESYDVDSSLVTDAPQSWTNEDTSGNTDIVGRKPWKAPCDRYLINPCADQLECNVLTSVCTCRDGRFYSNSLSKCKKDKYWLPRSVQVFNRSEDSIGITWEARPKSIADVEYYKISYGLNSDAGNPGTHVNVQDRPSVEPMSYIVTGLKPGTAYWIRLETWMRHGQHVESGLSVQTRARAEVVASVVNSTVSWDGHWQSLQFDFEFSIGCTDYVRMKTREVKYTGSQEHPSAQSKDSSIQEAEETGGWLPEIRFTTSSGCRTDSFPMTFNKRLDWLKRGLHYQFHFLSHYRQQEQVPEHVIDFKSCPSEITSLKILKLDSNSVSLMWNPPTDGGVDNYRLITQTPPASAIPVQNISLASSETTATVAGLDKGKQYSFILESVFGDCSTSMTVTAQTVAEVPDSLTYVSVHIYTNTTLYVDWPQEWASVRKKVHVWYRVHVTCSQSTLLDQVTNATSLVIDSSPRGACCQVSVSAVNAAGEGVPLTKQLDIRSSCPSKPRDLTVDPVGETVNVTWSAPDEAVEQVIQYKVTLRGRWSVETTQLDCDGPGCRYPCSRGTQRARDSNFIFAANQSDFALSLPTIPGEAYIISVTAGANDFSSASTTHSFTCPEIAPSSPVQNLQWDEAQTTKSEIYLSWTKPQRSNGQVTGYNVSVSQAVQACDGKTAGSTDTDASNNTWYLLVKHSNTARYVIPRLSPYTNYTFRVTAINRAGQSMHWSKGVMATTKPVCPSKPRDLTVDPMGETVNVTWSAPDEAVEQVIQYKVTLRGRRNVETIQLDCDGPGCRYPCSRGTQRARDSNFIFAANQSDFALSLPTIPGEAYSISVTARAKECSLTSTTQSFTSPEIAPSSPVQNLLWDKAQTTKSEIYLSWAEPQRSNGQVTSYNVSVSQAVQACNGKTQGSSDTDVSSTTWYLPVKHRDTGSYVIPRLSPYTNYTFRVTAINRAGQSMHWSKGVMATTKPVSSVTGPVTNVQIIPGRKWAMITWGPPCPLTGPINAYALYISSSPDKYWANSTSYNMTDLLPFTEYNVSIWAKVISWQGNGVIESFTTLEDVPGPVENLTVSQELQLDKPRRLFAQWTAPSEDQRYGRITGYNVTIEVTNVVKTYRTVELFFEQQATPESTYKVQVCAETSAGPGTVTTEFIYISAGVVPAPIENSSKPLVHQRSDFAGRESTGTVTLNLPLEFLCTDKFGTRQQVGVFIQREKDIVHGKAYSPSNDVLMGWSNTLSASSVVLIKPATVPCSATAQVSEIHYVIGSQGDCAHPGCNRRLEAGETYRFQAYVCTKSGCSLTLKSLPITLADDSSDNSSLVIGVVISLFVLVVLLVLFVVGLKYRRKLPFFNRPPAVLIDTEDITLEQVQQALTRPILIANMTEHVEMMHNDSNLLFSEEYKAITHLSPKEASTAGENNACKHKNRYTNVLPFDHARVKLLPIEDDESSDYINASFIPGNKGPREYIAAQGPLACTKDDFWRMIWEKGVTAVVMLTQCTERGKVKCEEYWPTSPTCPVYFGDLLVSLRSVSVLPDYVIRVMDLQLGGKLRTVYQFHFLKWPDFGCPDKTYLLLNLVSSVRDHTPHNPNSPMLVHCSAGVGRTGTFIALDILLQQIRNPAVTTVDIFNMVLTMRKNRPLMVQRENQYIYIFDCLRDALREESEDESSVAQDGAIYQNSGLWN